MSIDDQELRAIAFLASRVRRATPGAGPWDEFGLMSNLRKLQDRNLHMTIESVLRHAADPKAKSPGVIVGNFTPKEAPKGRTGPPRWSESCPRCGGYRGICACTTEHLAWDADDVPTMPGADAAACRQALARSQAEEATT